jgi:hypothetical protein
VNGAVGLFHTTGPKLARLAGKYRPLVPVLRELILRPDTPLDEDVKDMIARQLYEAEDRFAAICGDRDAAESQAFPCVRGEGEVSTAGTSRWPGANGGPVCLRCGRAVRVNRDGYQLFEQMHYVCFHYEFEHSADPDEECDTPGARRPGSDPSPEGDGTG